MYVKIAVVTILGTMGCLIPSNRIEVTVLPEANPKISGKIGVPTFTLSYYTYDDQTGEGEGNELSEPWSLTDSFISNLMAKGYKVIERSWIDNIIDELKVTQSDVYDAETTSTIGNLSGVDILVYGYIRVERALVEDIDGSKTSYFPTIIINIRGIKIDDGMIVFNIASKFSNYGGVTDTMPEVWAAFEKKLDLIM